MDILSLIEGGKSKEAKQSLRNSLKEGDNLQINFSTTFNLIEKSYEETH